MGNGVSRSRCSARSSFRAKVIWPDHNLARQPLSNCLLLESSRRALAMAQASSSRAVDFPIRGFAAAFVYDVDAGHARRIKESEGSRKKHMSPRQRNRMAAASAIASTVMVTTDHSRRHGL